MKRTTRLLIALAALGSVALVVSLAPIANATANRPSAPSPVRSCESLMSVHLSLPDATTSILSAVSVPATDTVPAYCEVKVVVSNGSSNDQVRIGVWLPTNNWNRRFQGIGGGGFSAGSPDAVPTQVVQAGYAAAATDAGHSGLANLLGDFAVNPDGTPNWQLINDFGYLGIHEMTVAAKTLVRRYYGTSSFYSYWNGCSTGGRQGLMEAQRYPDDYDGIAAASPAINWTKFHPAQLWGMLVMHLSGNTVSACKLNTATQAAIAACDGADRLVDGIVGDWAGCAFDAMTLVGTVAPCGETITAADAEVINKIWEGPRTRDGDFLWYGFERDADMTWLNGRFGGPFPITLSWFQYWLKKIPSPLTWDWHTLTYDEYEQLFEQSIEEFQDAIATDDPDLSAFRNSGGKLVFWHGTADQLIYFRGTVDYYDRLEAAMGGRLKTQRFARFFVAPGVTHCAGGAGATPTNALDAVVQWVEQNKAPKELVGQRVDADGNVVLARPVCQYPAVARYKGFGDPDSGRNFLCIVRPHERGDWHY